ncbi:MAG: UDP-N-acetylglucosamine 2-epimerase (non-hydrolyzing) [Nanoarchaeota archaeon]
MKIGIALGTRPEIIKLAPIIRECEKRKLDYFVIHTNQHYSYELDKLFFDELELPQPKYNLECGFGEFRKHVGFMSKRALPILKKEKPDNMIILADTTSALGVALASSKANLTMSHVEAGLRSHDTKMLEETNRIVVGHLSDYHFPPTEKAKQNLIEEGVDEDKIFVVGNTIVDSVNQNIELANKKVDMIKKLNIEKNNYFLLTAHRQENVDDKERLSNILKGLELVYNKYKLPIIYPMHPRTKKMIQEFNLKVPNCITVLEPLSFLEFLQLEANAKLVITDSGGIQEETCILKIPCVTIRDNTERPETLEVGSNILAGVKPERILECVNIMINKERNWEQPFGDGTTAVKVLDIINKLK